MMGHVRPGPAPRQRTSAGRVGSWNEQV